MGVYHSSRFGCCVSRCLIDLILRLLTQWNALCIGLLTEIVAYLESLTRHLLAQL